jgi:transcriptional regulator
MFVRPCWLPQSEEDVFAIMESNPWGLLVSNGTEGPRLTNVAWVLDRKRGNHGCLTSHISRANEHAPALLEETNPVLAVFHGPSKYISASWYPLRDMPPTVYYTAVHCYGSLSFQNNATLREAIEELTNRSERGVPEGWRTSEIPESDVTRRLPKILGFDLLINRTEAKFKLGQDEPKRDAMAVGERLLLSEDPADRFLGGMIVRFNEDRTG